MILETEKIERIIIGLIFLTLSLTFILSPKDELKQEFKIDENSFEIFPLIAWKTTHEKWDGAWGDIVKIKYRVTRSNTKLWIYDVETGVLVHEQPFDRDPWDDGRHRDFTYIWKLYKTERTKNIPSGQYEIVVGGRYEGGFGQLKTKINI
jgi:hypothetical protein|tara:strand:- start:92 stop:541 length:450 start_codon:yes stop_codon:yes gene_type:complete